MDPLTTPPICDYVPGKEILTKYKEAIRQLYKQAKFMPAHLAVLYYIGESIINCILCYNQITCIRSNYISRPHLLNDTQVN
jgi:hypothetical protein